MSMLQGFEAVKPAAAAGKAVLTITNSFVRFNKSAVIELGKPQYIKFMINKNLKQFAATPCYANDANAIPFYKPGKTVASVSIKNPMVMKEVVKYFDFLPAKEDEVSYVSIKGSSDTEDSAIIFDVADGVTGVMKKRGRKKASEEAEG